MSQRNTKFFSLVLIFTDFLAILGAFGIAYVTRVAFDTRDLLTVRDDSNYLLAVLCIIPVWLIVLAVLGVYSASTYNRRLVEWGRLAMGAFIGTLLVIGWEYISEMRIFPARLVMIYVLVGSFLFLVTGRELLRLGRTILFRYGRGVRRVLIVGNSEATYDIASSIAFTKKSGYKVVAIAGPKQVVPTGLDITQFHSVEKALDALKSLGVSMIIQTDLYTSAERNQAILATAQRNHIQYNFIPGEPEFYAGKNTVDVFLGYPMISVHQTPLIGWGEVVKRIFDITLVVITLPIWGVLFVVIWLLQKLLNPGPALYTSTRITQYSKAFDLYKFRSMSPIYGKRDAAEEFRMMGREDLAKEYETHRKVNNDPRITAFGGFLRATSLDELPQLFNVLRGDISLVGPRPILPQETKMLRAKTGILHSVKSGLTGLWQVSGRSELGFHERIELETYYAQNWSFWLDIKILLKTILVVLFQHGAK